MQTRKALGVFNKSAQEDTKISKDLSDSADKFLKQYEDREKYIASRKHQYEMSLPFVEALKGKIAKVTKSQVDESMPVIGTFELYSAIKRVASRSSSDRGLKRLAMQLEKSWNDDKSGSVTYGQLRSLVAVYRDQFPKSKAVDALQSECARLGYHKLPVAKLTRIASKIKNQSDYDIAVEVNDLAGDRPDQIRSREFIRAMVEHGVLTPVASKDHRSASERAMDRLASLDKEADLMSAIEKMKYAKEMAASLIEQLNSASQDMFEDGLEADGQTLNDLADQLSQWSAQLNTVEQSAGGDPGAESAPSEEVAPLERRGPDVPLWDRKTLSGPSPSERAQQMQDDADLDSAGMKKKWWDPRSWSFGKMSNLLDALDAATPLVSNRRYARILEKFAQMLPPPEEFVADDELLAPPAEDSFPPVEVADPGAPLDLPADASPEADVDTGDLAQAVDMMRDVEELVQDEAPSDVQNYINHEMSEGHHTALPGSSAWGAEEILFEDHSSPPPSEQWLAEEESEILGTQPTPDMPMTAAAKKPKKMSLPGKVKSQPNQERKLKFGPGDAARVLKAEHLESLLLSGKKVVAGKLSMFVNDNDEIELWRGRSGRAASLNNIDVVIADFRRMAQLEMTPAVSAPEAVPMQPPMQVSELAPPAQPAAAPGLPEDEEQAVQSSIPLNETIAAALTNYKSQGMNFLEAMKEFNKEHGSRMEEWGPTADTSLISVAQQLWSGDMAGMPMLASSKSAAGMKVPKVSKPKDKVKVDGLGEDTSQADLKLPGKINQSVKPKGKMSPKELGKDTSQDDNLPSPGKPNANPNDPAGKPGVKLPNKDLGKDTGSNEGFKVPSLGSQPSARRAQVKSDLPPESPNEIGRTLVSNGDGHFLVLTDESGSQIFESDDAGVQGGLISLAQGGHAAAVNDVMSGMFNSDVIPSAEPTEDMPPLDVERGVPQSGHQPQPTKNKVEHLMGRDGPEPILKKQKQPIDL